MSDTAAPHPIRSCLVGFALALALTAGAFVLVATRSLRPIPTAVMIAILALIQVLVHLRWFLHLDFHPHSRERLIALAFAVVVVFVMAGGTLWIMANLNARMGM